MAKYSLIVLLMSLVFGSVIVRAADTPAGCTNYACDYCEDFAASCQNAASATQNGTDCLCTERFRVNLDRCVRGYTCAWDGVSTAGACLDIYCPGSGMDAFVAQCGLPPSSSGVNSNTMAPSTILPTPRPQTVTTNSSISTQASNSTTVTGTASTTPSPGGASSLHHPLWVGFAAALGIATTIY